MTIFEESGCRVAQYRIMYEAEFDEESRSFVDL